MSSCQHGACWFGINRRGGVEPPPLFMQNGAIIPIEYTLHVEVRSKDGGIYAGVP